MAVSNSDLRGQIKVLRNQVARMEESMKVREDKLTKLFITIEPFLNQLSPSMIADIEKMIEEDEVFK